MKAAGRAQTLEHFDVAPYVRARMGADLAACRDAIRPELALYIGGMGARSKNFYNDVAVKLGYPDAARKIQDLYLDGKKTEAAAAIPDALVDEISLIGPADRICDRLAAWQHAARDHHIRTLVLKTADCELMRVVAEAVL
jgi:alkanesulfonate monooxygenase SsuD/methylene tetrahydromethanopterin reductase-like flavin-dependent oxidoreductase (luciferase family)